jgi:hypothetical protein
MGLLERLLPMRRPPLWMEPPAVLPGLVGEVLVLAHTDAAAVAITGLGGYPTGFSFRLRVLLRREKPVSHGFDLSLEMHRWRGRRGSPPPEFLRLGVQFADGSMISNMDSLPFDEPDEPAGPQLVETSGAGDLRGYEFPYWVWRLPPPGPVIFTCQWLAYEIQGARAQIDAQRIRDAAARSIYPWPGDS